MRKSYILFIVACFINIVNSQSQTEPISVLQLNTIRKVGQQILKDVSKDYTVDDLAAECGLSQAKLQEGFKILYTRTVIEYLRHVRLEEARDLLNNTDYNISQVVYSIGFSSRSYFSKIFKRKYGISPSKFLANKKEAKVKEVQL